MNVKDLLDRCAREQSALSGIRLFACMLIAAMAVFGQGTTGSIDITLTDSSGALVPGAALVASNTGTIINANRLSVTNIKIRLPIISSGARVPMRKETCTMRWKAVVSLERRTMSCPVLM